MPVSKTTVSTMPVTEDDVRWCYQTLLRRAPESQGIIDYWVRDAVDLRDLVNRFLGSAEYKDYWRDTLTTGLPAAPRRWTVEYSGETIVSFAQNCEDVLLYRAFKGKSGGTFIDVGAGHPIADNVTLWLRQKGWRGVNVEPNPIYFRDLQKYRPEDINLNVGVADKAGELLFYQVEQNEVGHGWGMSSFDSASETLAQSMGFKVNRLRIPVITLNEIAERHYPGGVDVLKLDVEGLEEAIIQSTDWRRFRPKLICVEAVEPVSARPAWPKWENFLTNADYVFAAFDGVNCYYCPADEESVRGQLSAPICCNDKYRRATGDDIAAAARSYE